MRDQGGDQKQAVAQTEGLDGLGSPRYAHDYRRDGCAIVHDAPVASISPEKSLLQQKLPQNWHLAQPEQLYSMHQQLAP